MERKFILFFTANFFTSTASGIVLVLVPWLLVKNEGATYLAIIAASVTAMIVVAGKRARSILDSLSRSKIMSVNSLLMSFSVFYLFVFGESTFSLTLVFIHLQIYIFFYYASRSALTHEISKPEQYGKINGFLEIENQVSTFTAGGLAVFFLSFATVENIYFIAALVFLPASLLFLFVARGVDLKDRQETNGSSINSDHIVKSIVFLGVAASSPFISVMILNVVKPIFVEDLLNETAEVLAISSICYTIGAGMSGLAGKFITNEIIGTRFIYISILSFSIFTFVMSMFPHSMSLYVCSIVWGIANGVSRVSLQTIVMRNVSNSTIGNVFALIQIFVGVERSLLLLAYAFIGSILGYSNSFTFVTLIAISGLPMMLLASSMLKRKGLVI